MSRVHYFRAGLPDISWKVEAIKMFAENYPSTYDEGFKYHLRGADDIELHPSDKKHLPNNKTARAHAKNVVLKEIVDWIADNADDIREVSFRTVAKLIAIRNLEPDFWREMSLSYLCI